MLKFLPILIMGLCLGLVSCDEDSKKEDVSVNPFVGFNTPDSGTATDIELDAVIATYVDAVVIPTYKDMVDKMNALNSSVQTLTSDAQLDNAAAAWKAARKPWEQSEAFLFGAADLNSLDPSLDSWPLDKGGIDQILVSGDWGAIGGGVDEDEDAPNPPQNLRGFHTAEYLLFENGDARKIVDMNAQPNQKIYLQKVVAHMVSDTEMLLKGWTTGEGLESGAYGEAMKKHNGTYSMSNVKQAIAMMLNSGNGMEAISNEVGATKIGDPVSKWNSGDKEGGVLAVESWYSWNSLTDYTDNIYSIRNSYYGSMNGTPATSSLYNVMKKVNPTLNDLLVKQITATVEAINDIPVPFRNHLGSATEVKAAQAACAHLCSGLALVRSKLAGE